MSRIVDSCCTINLYAAGNLITLLPAIGAEWHIAEKVVTETLYIRRPDPDDASTLVREPINLRPALDAGVLLPCNATEDESALFVELATLMDDGEAMCLAIAQSRNWTLATDDRKARRIAGERGVLVVTTAEIVKNWADVTGADDAVIATLLQNIQRFARFVPHRTMPLHEWWVGIANTSRLS